MNCTAPHSQGYCQRTVPCRLGTCAWASENIAVTTTDHTAPVCKQCSPKDMALGRCDCLRDIYSASRRGNAP